jgi:hypothetical protein
MYTEFLWGNQKERKLGRSRHKWKSDVKICFRATGYELDSSGSG